MAPFYSRYVPASKGVTERSTNEEFNLPHKRRKVDSAGNEHGRDSSKGKSTARSGRPAQKSDVRRRSNSGSKKSSLIHLDEGKFNGKERPQRNAGPHGEQIHPTSTTTSRDSIGSSGKKKNGGLKQGDQSSAKEAGKAKRRKKEVDAGNARVENAEDEESRAEQHASIRAKFIKATKAPVRPAREQTGDVERDQRETLQPTEVHGLEPLPQPQQVPSLGEKPTFSSLPPWLGHPLRVDASRSTNFTDLGLDDAVLETLKQQGLEKAFAVQSAVIPLLLDGTDCHEGDICISAATGSGKTLAYVLPLMHRLRRLATTKLRALVVVPTRELVKQVKASFDACSVGTKVKILTALGSKSLGNEEDALVERYQVWDPEEYQAQQSAVVDWSEVTLDSALSDQENQAEIPANFVVKYRSKVDVLICTPGRLVDHIRSTKGFTLDDVQLLVIDEADRLLNESFQEWTDVVVPALDSRASSVLQDGILQHMRLELPQRVVQKVMLSATMTTDISKLSPLKLQNPKLVVIGGGDTITRADGMNGPALESEQDENCTFNLPSTLAEYGVPVGDGTEKPLYLLQLLRSKVNVFNLEHDEEDSSDGDQDDDTSASGSTGSDSDSNSTSSSSSTSANTERRGGLEASKQNGSAASTRTTGIGTGTGTVINNNTALIFTRSTESATRLSRLLSLLSKPIAALTATLTKSSTSSSSRKALADLRRHHVRIIIATDRASRGLDLPQLGHVISYDIPTSMTTYIHRVGRTARAGMPGNAWTLLAYHEARWFWNEIGKGMANAGHINRSGKVQKWHLKLDLGEDDETRTRYEKALQKLGEEVVGGTGGAAK